MPSLLADVEVEVWLRDIELSVPSSPPGRTSFHIRPNPALQAQSFRVLKLILMMSSAMIFFYSLRAVVRLVVASLLYQ